MDQLTFAQCVLPHVVKALVDRIDWEYRVHEDCGDDWPPDFDPNDVGMYLGVLRLVLDLWRTGEGGILRDAGRSKSLRFASRVVADYFIENKQSLSPEIAARMAELVDELRAATDVARVTGFSVVT
jgi:hypothetical protein